MPTAKNQSTPRQLPRLQLARWSGRTALSAICLTAWLAGLPTPLVAQSSLDPATLLAAAQERLDQGDAVGAEKIYRQVTRLAPGLADAHDGLALSLESQKRFGEAADILESLGKGWLDYGDAEAATGYLERSIRLDPNSASARALLGRAQLFQQRFAAGLPHLEAAVRLGDRSAITQLYLASALWENGRIDSAEDLLRTLVRAGGGVGASLQLARLLLWQGQAAEAVSILQPLASNSVVAASQGVSLRLDLARALEGDGQLEAAIEAYRSAAELAPDLSGARYPLARLLLRLGKDEMAEQELKTYRELLAQEQGKVRASGLARAQLDHAWNLLRTGANQEAADAFATLPETIESLRGAGLSLSAAGLHAEAAHRFERALGLDPSRQDIRWLLLQERQAQGEQAPGASH